MPPDALCFYIIVLFNCRLIRPHHSSSLFYSQISISLAEKETNFCGIFLFREMAFDNCLNWMISRLQSRFTVEIDSHTVVICFWTQFLLDILCHSNSNRCFTWLLSSNARFVKLHFRMLFIPNHYWIILVERGISPICFILLSVV